MFKKTMMNDDLVILEIYLLFGNLGSPRSSIIWYFIRVLRISFVLFYRKTCTLLIRELPVWINRMLQNDGKVLCLLSS